MHQKAYPGAFFVIEGTDGSGKSTQFTRLHERLTQEGYEVETFKFPQYDSPSSYFVTQYLNGVYGSADEVGPYTGSLFYALDRFEASSKIRDALEAGKVVLADRYTGSNMAHQGTKFSSSEERRGYFIWLDNLEFEMLGIPRPDRSIVLRVPLEVSRKQMGERGKRTYTDKQRDIHEADESHISRSLQVYDDLCQLFPKDFTRIDCARSDALMSVDDISNLVWESIYPLLPTIENEKGGDTMTKKIKNPTAKNPYIKKIDNNWHITREGIEFLEKSITDTTSNVYAFKTWLSTLTVAAGMARLSRRGDDMRVTILDEFATSHGKDEKLLQRVISAYGDDSVQQLVGAHFVVENASNLLTKQLEWGRLASYLEQSTRYIYFDQKDKDGRYKYVVPEQFDAKTKRNYQQKMDDIFDLYSEMVHKATDYIRKSSTVPKKEQDGAWKAATRAQACDAIRPVLPVATKATVGIYGSGQAIESMIMRLRASESQEARETGNAILKETRKIIPTFLERADKPERGGATTAYLANTRDAIKEFAKENLNESYGKSDEASVVLRSYSPRNELDTVPYMLYEHSSMSLRDIETQVDDWTIDKKIDAFRAYMGERLNRRHRPGRALEIPHYTWDLICDYGIFRDLQRHRMVDNLTWQQLTPRYGFDIPQIVEDAGLTDLFERCFGISVELYGELQAAGYGYEAQYATLLGHKMRWTITYNARQAFHLHELRTTPQGHPGYRKLVGEMHRKLAEVHPLTAEAMQFVSEDEDPELTRLAAERYSQYKLEKLS